MDKKDLSYEELETFIENMPLTWLPSIFIFIIKEALRRKIFTNNDIEPIVALTKRNFDIQIKNNAKINS